MKGYKVPVFTKGNLLSQEMLDAMKDYGVYGINNSYTGYSNGIVTGFKIHVEKGVIYIGEGLVRYEGRLLVSTESVTVPMTPAGQWQAVKLAITDYEKTKNFEHHHMDIEVSTNLEREANRMEICRVKLQNGANLRSEYRNFEDMETEFDTVNLINAQWSAYGEDSINPAVLLEFARQARKKNIANPNDTAFIQQILNCNGHALNRELIQFYINTRLERNRYDYTNMEIYEGLCRILKLTETNVMPKTEIKKPRRLIVD